MTNSQRQSAILDGAPGMASDYMHRETSTTYKPGIQLVESRVDDDLPRSSRDIVNFDSLSLLSVMQVISSLAIFGLGVLRIVERSKWAIGIEIAYAIFVLLTGVCGVYATSRRSHFAASATFVMSGVCGLLAGIPILIGLFPSIPYVFAGARADWFISIDEWLMIDYTLSLACFIEMLLALVTAVCGCMAIGSAMTHVENLRLTIDGGVDGSASSMHKGMETCSKKPPMD